MKLARNAELETVFVNSIREAMELPRTGLHRSSLFPCARKGKAIQVLKIKLREDEALFYAQGRSVHAFVIGDRFQPVEESLEKDGILDTPDGWTVVDGQRVPVEFKATRLSSRDFLDKVHQSLSSYRGAVADYLWQLLDHCLFAGTETGVLAVLFFMGDYGAKRKWCPDCKARVTWGQCKGCGWEGKRTELRTYTVTFDKRDFGQRWQEFETRRDLYLGTDDPLMVPPTPNWMCATCRPGEAIRCQWFGKKVA